MDRALDFAIHGLPVYTPLTREGEVELARRFEQGEILVLDGILATGIDARAVLIGERSEQGDSNAKDAALSPVLTPHRLEVVTEYVVQIERARREGISRKERAALLRPLVPHRSLTRRLLEAKRASERSREMPRWLDPRVRLGLARSEAAREGLLRANLGIVTRISRKYLGRGLSLQDLMQEGTIGLMRAIEKFDYRLGHRFVTYAAWWIRSVITRALADTSMEIRVPSYVVEMQRKMSIARGRLTEVSGDYPAETALARYLEVPEESLDRFSNVVKQPISLELPRDRGGDSDRTLGSIVADSESPLPDEIVASGEIADRVVRMLDTLRPREKELIRLRFGIGDGRDHTLQELGDRFGLSRERVRQIEVAALKKLKRAYERESNDLPAESA